MLNRSKVEEWAILFSAHTLRVTNSIHNFLEDEYSKVTEQTYFKIVEPDKSIASQLMRSNYLTGEPGKELIIDENTDTNAKKQRKVSKIYILL